MTLSRRDFGLLLGGVIVGVLHLIPGKKGAH